MTNDELDELRSFRPEATGPTDVLARDERNAFMQAITNDTAHQPTKRPLRRRLPRGRRVVLAFAVALVAAGGAAGAAGLIPDDVQRTLGLTAGGDPAFEANPSEATQRGSTTAADGTVVELWTAPTKGGGTCAYLRHLDAAGKPADGAPVTCQITTAEGATKGQARGSGVAGPSTGVSLSIGGSGGSLNTDMQEQAAGGVVAYGEAPKGTARVIFTDDAGIATTAAPNADEWFVLTLPLGTMPTAVRSIEARSASGTTLAHVDLPRPGDGGFETHVGGESSGSSVGG